MKIRLHEIPEEGRQYKFSRSTAELNSVLSDLIDENAYDVDLYIRPLNLRDFSLVGSLKTQTREQCSRCGEDFNLPITKKVNEILIPGQDLDRTSKSTKSNSFSETSEEITVSEYRNQNFDLGEFLHEVVALEVPFTPHCQQCTLAGEAKSFNYDEKMGEEVKANPFEALKGLKLN